MKEEEIVGDSALQRRGRVIKRDIGGEKKFF
jgi:hypothetical protein